MRGVGVGEDGGIGLRLALTGDDYPRRLKRLPGSRGALSRPGRHPRTRFCDRASTRARARRTSSNKKELLRAGDIGHGSAGTVYQSMARLVQFDQAGFVIREVWDGCACVVACGVENKINLSRE